MTRALTRRPPAPPTTPSTGMVAGYLSSLTPRSARTLRAALRAAARVLREDATEHEWDAPGALTAANVDRAVSELATRGQRVTARLARTALRGLARKAFTVVSDTRYAAQAAAIRRAIDDVRLPKRLRGDDGRRRGREWTEEEVSRLMSACRDGTARGLRDAAMVACLWGGALRCFEVAALDASDYKRGEEYGTLLVRHGKGDKRGLAALAADYAEIVEQWIEARGRAAGPLFPRFTPRGDKSTGQRITAGGVYYAIGERASAAGVNYDGTHDGRRTVATRLKKEPITTIQRVLRHADVSTTARYVQTADEEAFAAVARHVRLKR